MFDKCDQKTDARGRTTLPAVLLVALFAVLLTGCGSMDVSSTDMEAMTPAPNEPTPAPEVVQFQMSAAQEVASPPPPPTFTPTPAPTEVPFSYYAPTVNMSFEELVGGTSDFGEMGSKKVNWPKAYPPADTYKLVVDVYWQVVMAFSKDANGEYTVPVRYMLCSTGNPRIKDGGETRRGTFNMLVPRVRFGHFLSGEAAQYWSLIRGRTYFHSILYDKQDNMSTYQVEVYNALGTKASHGCIRLTVPDARWIWYNIAYGAVCEVRDGSKDDAVTAAIREQLVLPPAPAKQLTIKAGSTPYTDNWTIDTLLAAFDSAKLVPFKNEKQPPPAMTADDGTDDTTTGGTTGGSTGDGTTGATGEGTTGGESTDSIGEGANGGDTAGSSGEGSGSGSDIEFATGTS